MARGKVGAVRLVANWALIEPTDDAWRFGALDNYVGDLAVVLECTGSRSPSEPTNGLVLKSWKEFVAVVAQRYGPGGAHWTTRYPIDHPGEQPSPVKGLAGLERAERFPSTHTTPTPPSTRSWSTRGATCRRAIRRALVLHRRPFQGQRHQAQAGLEAVRPLYRRVVSFTGGS
jgi:hypothetical protein